MPRTAASVPFSTRALVLRARPLGEKDRVLTLFSPERGKFSAVARGARSPKGKLSALAQPFIIARFLGATGRTLDIITQAQIEAIHPHLSGDVLKMSWASFACECADWAPERVADEDGFAILQVFLDALNEAEGFFGCEAAGLWFGAQWLAHQGYAPTIGVCVSCGQKLEVQSQFWFGPQSGGTLCGHCRGVEASPERVSGQAMRAFHRLERSRRPPRLLSDAPFSLDERAGGELARSAMRALIAHGEGRLRSLPSLQDQRAAAQLEHAGDAENFEVQLEKRGTQL
jgi:DNA repair protein RecO (recombination protein O)